MYGPSFPFSQPGNTNYTGKLSIVNLLIKVACFVMKVYYIFNIKMS
jgi:hypothetical protein